MTSGSPRKRQRLTSRQGDSSGDEDQGETSAQGASRALEAFSHPTTVIRCKVASGRAANRDHHHGNRIKHGHEDDGDDVPLSAFPRLQGWEKTTRPAEARRNAYLEAKRRLDERFKEAVQVKCSSLLDDVLAWIDRVIGARDTLSRLGQQKILPLAAVQSALPDPLALQVLTRSIIAANDKSKRTLVAVLSPEEANVPNVGTVIDICCRRWALEMEDTVENNMQRGATAAWQRLMDQYRQLDTSPLLLLVLPSLPPATSPLFSTLSYLINLPTSTSTSTQPNIAIIVPTGIGPAGIDSLDISERRCLDAIIFTSPSERMSKDGAQAVLNDLFWPASSNEKEVYDSRLPSQALKHALQSSASHISSSAGTGQLQALHRWLTLALQYHYTHHYLSLFTSSSSKNSRALTSDDFEDAFFVSIRTNLIRALQGDEDDTPPELKMMPVELRNKQTFRRLFEDDEFLLQSCASLAKRDEELRFANKEIGLRMLQEVVIPLADANSRSSLSDEESRSSSSFQSQWIDSLRFSLLTSDTADAADTTVRKKVNDLLANSLRVLRRTESEGGFSIPALDTWLDTAEDWAQGLLVVTTATATATATVDPDVHSSKAIVGKRVLAKVRTLQQRLKILRDALGDVEDASAVDVRPEEEKEGERVRVIQRKLRREEEGRAFRKECADWLGAEIRHLLLTTALHTPLFPSYTQEEGEDFTAAIESLVAPTPRQHLTLALARPQIYLAHFLSSVKSCTTTTTTTPATSMGTSSTTSSSSPDLTTKRAMDDLSPLLLSSSSSSFSHSGQSRRDIIQTDLSIAYNLLREAGGAGTGVKGRLIHLLDWFHAWSSLRSPSSPSSSSSTKSKINQNQRRSRPSKPLELEPEPSLEPELESKNNNLLLLQARFALSLSTLSLLGYIKRTTKRSFSKERGGGGGGSMVLKVAGWEIVPGIQEDVEFVVREEGVGDGEREEEMEMEEG